MANPAGNAIEAEFGLNLSPLKRDFAEAEKIGAAGAANVQKAFANATAAGVQIPRRAFVDWKSLADERARAIAFTSPKRQPRTAADFLPALPGQYPIADVGAEKERERSRREFMRKLDAEGAGGATGRLPRGLGVGIGLIAGIGQIAQAYIRANEAAGELREKVIQVTSLTGSADFLGSEKAVNRLKEISNIFDDLGKRAREERAVPFSKLWRQLATNGSDEIDNAQKKDLRDAASRSIDDLAKKQQSLNEVESLRLDGKEKEAALLQSEINLRERLGQMAAAEVGAGDRQNLTALRAEIARGEIEKLTIARKYDLAAVKEAYDEESARIHRDSPSARAKSIAESARENARKADADARQKDQYKKLEDDSRESYEREQVLKTELSIEQVRARHLTHSKERVEIARREVALAEKRSLNATPENSKGRELARARAYRNLDEARFEVWNTSPDERRREEEEQRERGRLRKRFKDSAGLLNVHRDSANRVIGGVDPATGRWSNVGSRFPGLDALAALQARGPATFTPSRDIGHVGDTRTDADIFGGGPGGTMIQDLITAINNPDWAK